MRNKARKEEYPQPERRNIHNQEGGISTTRKEEYPQPGRMNLVRIQEGGISTSRKEEYPQPGRRNMVRIQEGGISTTREEEYGQDSGRRNTKKYSFFITSNFLCVLCVRDFRKGKIYMIWVSF